VTSSTSSAEIVVVVAGSAGAVIAARVTERADREVLLLEAGPDYPDPGALPGDFRDGGKNSWLEHDWGYRHRPTPRQMLFFFPRGKVVGGSSAVNTCIALRPLPCDLDEWAALGLPEWRWDACLPYLLRMEDDRDFDAPWHYEIARTGPMRALARFLWPLPRTLADRERLGAWIYRSCGSGYHPSGTAPMGSRGRSGRGGRRPGARARGGGARRGGREHHAHHPHREHQPDHADDRRALRRVAARRITVSASPGREGLRQDPWRIDLCS
jgi:choline dehydrogenase